MDKISLTEELIDTLISDIDGHPIEEKLQLMDWLMANQLTKSKKTIALIDSWERSQPSLKRRTYWYYQGRKRWTGQPQTNSENLLSKIEQSIENEEPHVQWAMNFTTGWIGVFEKKYRDRCVALGQKTGLYKNDKVSKGCTPDYLPKFITIESGKRNL